MYSRLQLIEAIRKRNIPLRLFGYSDYSDFRSDRVTIDGWLPGKSLGVSMKYYVAKSSGDLITHINLRLAGEWELVTTEHFMIESRELLKKDEVCS